MRQVIFLLFTLLALLPVKATAQLIQLDSLWLKEDVERLASANILDVPVNTWPLSAKALRIALDQVDVTALDDDQNMAFERLNRVVNNSRSSVSSRLALQLSTEDSVFFDASEGMRARNGLEFSSQFARSAFKQNDDVAAIDTYRYWGDFRTRIVSDVDRDTLRYDGSVLGATLGNWLVSVGKQDRWWGDGWRHSLILSNNARPTTSLTLQRDYPYAFESPWLSWIGPWSANVFLGLLDDERVVEDAKLFGMSLQFRPHSNVDIGLRRTAQWGGEDREETLSNFVDLLIGKDNCDESNQEAGIACNDRSQEPGNQLAGIDISFRRLFGQPIKSSLQVVGEDEAGFAPAKNTFTASLRYFGSYRTMPVTINLEAVETKVLTSDDAEYNIFYEHSIYRTGYRYEGRSIGSTLDNDSSALHLDAMVRTSSFGDYLVGLSVIDLNADGRGDRHTLVSEAESVSQLHLDWRYRLLENINATHDLDLKFTLRDETLETRLGTLDQFSMRVAYQVAF